MGLGVVSSPFGMRYSGKLWGNNALAWAIVLAFAGCSSSSSNPSEVAQRFAIALQQHDWEAAKQVSTPETQQMLAFVERLTTDTPANSAREVEIEVIDVRQRKDTAEVMLRGAGRSADGAPILLVHSADGWLVHMPGH